MLQVINLSGFPGGSLAENLPPNVGDAYPKPGWGGSHILLLKLKLQYFGQLMQRADSLEKILMLGKLRARGEGGSSG